MTNYVMRLNGGEVKTKREGIVHFTCPSSAYIGMSWNGETYLPSAFSAKEKINVCFNIISGIMEAPGYQRLY